MIRTVFALLLLTICTMVYGQQELSTIYLKDGTVFIGKIIEKTPEGSYVVMTTTGVEMIFLDSQIAGIATGANESGELESYGGKQSVGPSLLGSGLFGLHYRQGLGEKLLVDLGVHFALTQVQISLTDESFIKGGVATAFGLNYAPDRQYNAKKAKVGINGAYLNFAYIHGRFNATKLSLGWSKEFFSRGNFDHSFLLELGPVYKIRHWMTDPQNAQYAEDRSMEFITIHLKLVWNIYFNKKQVLPNDKN